jgi:hypothetical protein
VRLVSERPLPRPRLERERLARFLFARVIKSVTRATAMNSASHSTHKSPVAFGASGRRDRVARIVLGEVFGKALGALRAKTRSACRSRVVHGARGGSESRWWFVHAARGGAGCRTGSCTVHGAGTSLRGASGTLHEASWSAVPGRARCARPVRVSAAVCARCTRDFLHSDPVRARCFLPIPSSLPLLLASLPSQGFGDRA